jgi:hypothetical protein
MIDSRVKKREREETELNFVFLTSRELIGPVTFIYLLTLFTPSFLLLQPKLKIRNKNNKIK